MTIRGTEILKSGDFQSRDKKTATLKKSQILFVLHRGFTDCVKMGLSFAVGFIQRLLNRERELDFSHNYKIVGLKSGSLSHSKIRPINGTAKDKKTVFTLPIKRM